jgi:hypothetical protein
MTTIGKSMDLTPLVKINENVMFAKANTSLMLQKLKDFENRLTKLDEELLPIQNVIYIKNLFFALLCFILCDIAEHFETVIGQEEYWFDVHGNRENK